MSVLLLALMLAAPPSAGDIHAKSDAPTVVAAQAGVVGPEDEVVEYFRLQVILDAGLPDGLGLGLSLAPLPHLRLSLAALTNVIGYGIRGGLALVPFASWAVHPIFSLELGRYFTGDARQFIATGPANLKYDFIDTTAGLELSLSKVVIRVSGGVSRVWASQELTIAGYALSGIQPCAKLSVGMKID